jgi:fumarate hydratase subunit alpha
MATIDIKDVENKVNHAVKTINFETPDSNLIRLTEVLKTETSTTGKLAMQDIVENRRIASERQVPMCQDTGMVLVFVDIGEEAQFSNGNLRDAITSGVRKGYQEGYLRNSIVQEPLFERKNTGDNTPVVLHFDLVPGNNLRLTIAAKGFGAENMSWVKVLTPAEGISGVKREVVRAVEEAGPNACPPVIVGVGIGGTIEKAALLAKRALMRNMGERNPDQRYSKLEEQLLDLINATGVGPQGWGGVNTALDVRIEFFPTHIAAIPLAVNLDCHLHRHISIIF